MAEHGINEWLAQPRNSSDETMPFRVGCTPPPPSARVHTCLSPQESASVGEFPALGPSREESRPPDRMKETSCSSAKVHCLLCPRVPAVLSTLWSGKCRDRQGWGHGPAQGASPLAFVQPSSNRGRTQAGGQSGWCRGDSWLPARSTTFVHRPRGSCLEHAGIPRAFWRPLIPCHTIFCT